MYKHNMFSSPWYTHGTAVLCDVIDSNVHIHVYHTHFFVTTELHKNHGGVRNPRCVGVEWVWMCMCVHVRVCIIVCVCVVLLTPCGQHVICRRQIRNWQHMTISTMATPPPPLSLCSVRATQHMASSIL